MRTHIVTAETLHYMLEWCWLGEPSNDGLSAPTVPGYHSHVLGRWIADPDVHDGYNYRTQRWV